MTTALNMIAQIPGHFISVGNFLLTLIFVSFILRSKRPPGSTLAWLFFIVIIPYVGIPFYIFFSGRKFGSKLQNKEKLFEPQTHKNVAGSDTIERILENLGTPRAKLNYQATLLTSGKSAYLELSKLIESAEHTISLTTFIFANDDVGRAILNLLCKKASQGVKVGVLLDSLGSLWVRHPSVQEFKKCGGEIGYFMPLLHMPLKGRSNLRNHRKIIIVDGKKAILGGMNIAEEYMGPKSDPRQWIDLGLIIQGPSVNDLQDVFAKDWKFATGSEFQQYSPPVSENPETQPDQRLQIVASGPDVNGDPLYDVLLTLIFKAKSRLWIATPYFIPDESLAKALQLAAQRGIDVRILVPEKSNHRTADLARGTYLKQVLSAGCKVYFLPKMIHAKAFLVDEEYAIIGSANFDMRSLLFNYEIGILISSVDAMNSVRDWFTRCFSEAHFKEPLRGFWIDIVEGIGRVLGPLI